MPRKASLAKKSYRQLLRTIVPHLKVISGLDNLHLTSIAKIVEQHDGNQTKVTFRPVPEGTLGKMRSGALATQVHRIPVPGSKKPMRIWEYVILYYESEPTLKKRFCIAHELGHIMLHSRLLKNGTRRVTIPLGAEFGAQRVVHLNDFTAEEELEADLFAAVLTEQRPPPAGRKALSTPCIKQLRKLVGPSGSVHRPSLYALIRRVPTPCTSGHARASSKMCGDHLQS